MFAAYCRDFVESFGQGWNRFWYTPAHPLPLGIMRIVTGLLLLASLLTYTSDLQRFLSNYGVLPVDTVVALQTRALENGGEKLPWRWSYLDGLGGRELEIAHYVGIAVVVAYTLGIFTRFTAVAALIVLLSYLHRNPTVTYYHERMLAFLMFYLSLGPCGATLSIDRWLANRKGLPPAQPSWAAGVSLRLIQIHMAVVSFMMASRKLSRMMAATWWGGTAVWWLAVTPDGPMIDVSWINRGHRLIINFWTHAIAFFELAMPFLIWNRLARPLLFVLSVLVWTSVMLLTGQVLFTLSLMTGMVSFLSGETLLALCPMCRRMKVATA